MRLFGEFNAKIRNKNKIDKIASGKMSKIIEI